jgi:hypothetical protein
VCRQPVNCTPRTKLKTIGRAICVEETRSVIRLYITVSGEMLDESIVGELTSPGKIVHAFADSDESMSVVDKGSRAVIAA